MRVAGDAQAAFFGRAFSYSPFVGDGRGRELGRPLALARSLGRSLLYPAGRLPAPVVRPRPSKGRAPFPESRHRHRMRPAPTAHRLPARRVDSPSEAGTLVVAGEGSRQRGVSVLGHWGLVARGNGRRTMSDLMRRRTLVRTTRIPSHQRH